MSLFGVALQNLRNQQKRSLLTIVGIFIGIVAVVALISLGEGLEQAVNGVFSEIGTDKLFLQPSGGFDAAGGGDLENAITNSELRVIEQVRGVETVSALMYRSAQVEVGEDLGFYFIVSLSVEDQEKYDLEREAFTIDLIDGRELRSGDRNNVLVGFDYTRKEVFEEPLDIGDRLVVEGQTFTVAGINEPVGNAIDDRTVYLPRSTMEELIGVNDEFDYVIIRTSPNEDPGAVGEVIERELLHERDLDPSEQDFQIQTPEDILSTFGVILDIIQAVLVGIAGISLVVGGVGIMNTMYTAVLERTKEIGIMKAIGATPTMILRIFLYESAMLGFIGGFLGTAVGLGFASFVAWVGQTFMRTELLSAYISWQLILGALAFGTLAGALSGIFPAWAAAKQEAVESLRYE